MSANYLFDSAYQLTEDEACGHGNHWDIFSDDLDDFIVKKIPLVLQEGTVIKPKTQTAALVDRLLRQGELSAAGIQYSDKHIMVQSPYLLAVIALNVTNEETGEKNNLFYSAYPCFPDGALIQAQVDSIGIQPNRLEARLDLVIDDDGPVIFAFDTQFWQNRGVYQAGLMHPFYLSGLAYEIAPLVEKEIIIDDPEFIRKHHARMEYLDKHGAYFKEYNEEQALQEWKPESEEDLEPIHFSLDKMAAYLPNNQIADDASFQGEIVSIVKNDYQLFGVNFWKLEVIIVRYDDKDIAVPIYVAEHLLKENWQPDIGDSVRGTAWFQCHLSE
jgi:hypothetical protein